MPIFTKFSRDQVLPISNENAAASFYKWMQDLFDHPEGYTVVLDQELRSPENRQALPFPCLVLNQTDTSDPGRGFMNSEADQNSCLFYIYCLVHKGSSDFGSVRLLRRMKDQVVFALKRAGIYDQEAEDLVVPPIIMWDFSQRPPVELPATLSMNNNIVQHFTDEDEIMQYELLVSFRYMVDGKNKGA
jgi:hypothetical protein